MRTSESTSFDGLHHLTYTDTGKTHIYKLDGERVPGATTPGACYPKGPGLIRWMIAQGLEEYDNKTKLNKAGAIGRVVHKFAECHMTAQEFDWALVDGAEDAGIIRDCIRQYEALAGQNPDDKLYMAEGLVASPTLRVASQIDLVLVRNGKVVIRDYKTGKKVYVSALHQTVLYRRMLREWCNIECNELEIFKFSKEPDSIPVEICTVDNTGLTINGQLIEREGLLEELERQTVRNIETYRHAQTVESILTKYYEKRK